MNWEELRTLEWNIVLPDISIIEEHTSISNIDTEENEKRCFNEELVHYNNENAEGLQGRSSFQVYEMETVQKIHHQQH